MTFNRFMQHAAFVAPLFLFALVSCEMGCMAQETGLEESLTQLRDSSRSKFLRKRQQIDDLVRTRGFEQQLRTIRENANDWEVALLADSMLYRMNSPQNAELLNRFWTPAGCGRFGPQKSILLRIADEKYATIIIRCFGSEAFSTLAENLLYTHSISQEQDVMRALLEMRDRRSFRIFLTILTRDTYATPTRVCAVYCLKRLSKGLEEKSFGIASETGERKTDMPAGVVGLQLPAEVEHLAKPRNLGRLVLNEAEDKELARTLVTMLGSEKDERLRAMLAWALQGNKYAAADNLVTLAKNDKSPLVRAWLAMSLRSAGADRRQNEIDDLKKLETEKDVLKVLNGTGTPVQPWNDSSEGSILEESKAPEAL